MRLLSASKTGLAHALGAASLTVFLAATGCASAGAAAPPAQVASCAGGTDSDGNACEARQTASQGQPNKSAASQTPPALARLLTPPDDLSAAAAADAESGEISQLSVERMYRAAWSFQRANDFDRARVIYGDILTYFPGSRRAAYARFQQGEMFLKEGLSFGSYLDDAASAYSDVAGDPQSDPALTAFALMRLGETCELTGDVSRETESKERLARDFPDSDAAKTLKTKAR